MLVLMGLQMLIERHVDIAEATVENSLLSLKIIATLESLALERGFPEVIIVNMDQNSY